MDICKNKPNWKKQKFVTVVTKLWHCDEIRRFDSTDLTFHNLHWISKFKKLLMIKWFVNNNNQVNAPYILCYSVIVILQGYSTGRIHDNKLTSNPDSTG